jgi:hypothetical protein
MGLSIHPLSEISFTTVFPRIVFTEERRCLKWLTSEMRTGARTRLAIVL